ncbi:MAG: hypothetical protein GY710_00920 [Desulfobacteraceae bacterium]|nr:hypothetical protein [Desulfobacteraceae bacterium]
MKILRKITILIVLICLTPALLFAKHLYPEKYYQNIWCAEKQGKTEQVLSDRTRCDCLTDTHSIEVDFAPKWAESIGQALHYSIMTGKSPGILLIIEKEKDWKYYHRVRKIIESYKLPVTVWTISLPAPESSD